MSDPRTILRLEVPANLQYSPFSFLTLPPEIRNTIYKYVAACPLTSEDPAVKIFLKKREERLISEYGGKVPISEELHGSLRFMIVQPSLFAVSRQIRFEGHPLYFQHHKFACCLRVQDYENISLPPLLKWLRAVHSTGRTNIHHLRFRAHCNYTSKRVMDEVHQELSEDATVTWEPESRQAAMGLWDVGCDYKSHNPDRLPVFMVDRKPAFSTFDPHHMPNLYGNQGTSLTFYPRMGWFGKNEDSSAKETDSTSDGESSSSEA